jgi:hypothetical protein
MGREAMATSLTVHRAERRRQAQSRLGGRIVGMVFLWTSGINLGIAVANAGFFRHFADSSYLPFVRQGWTEVVMAQPGAWGLLLSVGEATLGGLLLAGGRWAKVGWVGVIAFHVLLMLFGFGFWLWSVPVLAALVPLARRDWAVISRRTGPPPPDRRRAEQEAQARALRRAYEHHPANGGPPPRRSGPATAPAARPRSAAPRHSAPGRSPRLTLVRPPDQGRS